GWLCSRGPPKPPAPSNHRKRAGHSRARLLDGKGKPGDDKAARPRGPEASRHLVSARAAARVVVTVTDAVPPPPPENGLLSDRNRDSSNGDGGRARSAGICCDTERDVAGTGSNSGSGERNPARQTLNRPGAGRAGQNGDGEVPARSSRRQSERGDGN